MTEIAAVQSKVRRHERNLSDSIKIVQSKDAMYT